MWQDVVYVSSCLSKDKQVCIRFWASVRIWSYALCIWYNIQYRLSIFSNSSVSFQQLRAARNGEISCKNEIKVRNKVLDRFKHEANPSMTYLVTNKQEAINRHKEHLDLFPQLGNACVCASQYSNEILCLKTHKSMKLALLVDLWLQTRINYYSKATSC